MEGLMFKDCKRVVEDSVYSRQTE